MTRHERYEIKGHRLHVATETDQAATEIDQAAVWLNTEEEDYDGLCIGCGETRQKAIDMAVATLEAVIVQLKVPPAE